MRTEQIDPRYVDLDTWSASEMIAAMYEGQLEAAGAVRGALAAIAAAVEDAVPALQRGGRIVYAGAGTSGRIGVQDGAELAPTYDWPEDRVVFAIAGGLDALVRSSEGAEDNEAAGAKALSTMDAEPLGSDIIHSVINPIDKLTGAIHIYGGDFFAAERSEWDSMTLEEHRSDGERTRRVFEEANARYEATKHLRTD